MGKGLKWIIAFAGAMVIVLLLRGFAFTSCLIPSAGLHLKKDGSLAKKELINYIEMKSGYVLDEGTEPGEIKFNIFDHQPRKRNDSGR